MTQTTVYKTKIRHLCLGLFMASHIVTLSGQNPWQRITEQPATLGLESGVSIHETPEFLLKLVHASQTVAALQPAVDDSFDFTPSDRLEYRSRNHLYHLGDLTLRLRIGENREWIKYSSAAQRAPVKDLGAGGNILASSDMAATFPDDLPLEVHRFWEMVEGKLVLRFTLTNTSPHPVEIGSLGIPLIFNNLLHNKSLDEAHAECVFFDPYIGRDAGYLQVIRLHGHGPVLLVLPYGDTPFEAYNPLLDDPTPKGVTFEGFHEWMAHSRAHAEEDWREAEPWNRPTSARLNPGESRSYGLRFVTTDTPRSIESALIAHERPVAVGIPGYVLPKDVNARLFLKYPEKVRSVDVEPAGALLVSKGEPTPNGWETYHIQGLEWGRARLTVTYADRLKQTIHYNVIKPEEQVVADMGRFMTNEQWYENEDDLFGRSPSVITYDYEKMAPVLEDGRAWIAGLSDEGGAGSWLAAIMKQLILPDMEELEKLRRFVHETMWGGIQYNEGERKYGVRKSMFLYEPDEFPPGTYSEHINYGSWSAWNRREAESVVRSYNYPHVAAAHWVFYRLTRNHQGYISEQPWDWYLENAGHTAIAMVEQAPHYAQYGQMEGTVFLMILLDLQREGMTDLAERLEEVMKGRADLWNSLNYPFGSEMPWDSTGQEEVYAWSRYFGYDEKADVTLNAILAYMPTVPHWGYNGSARRYWDFVYAGKLTRIERQIHHYGSALNSLPVLSEFRENPDDLYLLRVGHAGVLGGIANITREGFAPAAFHSYPSTLRIDGINGDYGPGFLGYTLNTGTYVKHDQEFGWLSFSGELEQEGDWITVIPTNADRSRVFLADLGLWLTLDAGKFEKVAFNMSAGQVRVSLDPANTHTKQALLRIEQPSRIQGIGSYAPASSLPLKRGAFEVPLQTASTTINLMHK
jgi:hypothetical protein